MFTEYKCKCNKDGNYSVNSNRNHTVIEQYYGISCKDENRDDKIRYLAKSLECKQLSLHELI